MYSSYFRVFMLSPLMLSVSVSVVYYNCQNIDDYCVCWLVHYCFLYFISFLISASTISTHTNISIGHTIDDDDMFIDCFVYIADVRIRSRFCVIMRINDYNHTSHSDLTTMCINAVLSWIDRERCNRSMVLVNAKVKIAFYFF